MNTTTKPRRSGAKIMAQLIVLLGSLVYIMLLAVINGTAGFLCAMGVTLSGAAAIAKALGEEISLSYGALIALAVGCGVLRGLLRFAEQYGNHYIAFRLLAVLRDKIFTALRRLCPAKLETRQKGAIIAMITSDIETLEVFYAHTISPICIAVLLSVGMTVFIGCVSSWYLALAAAAGYVTIGVLVPLVFSRRVRVAGQAYRAEFSSFSAYFLDSIRGIRDIVLHNAGAQRAAEVGRRSEVLLAETKKMKHETARAAAGTELCVSLFILAGLAVGTALTVTGALTPGAMLLGVAALFGSFGPVIAISALPGNLTQTLASGERVLDLLEEESAVREVEEGEGEKIDGFAHLSADGVTFSYDGVTNVLSDVWMYAERGEIVGIVGESGCGKSTTANVMCGLQSPTSGKVYFKGQDVTKRTADMRKTIGRVISVVFQDPATALNARMTVRDQLADPMIVHKVGDKASRAKRVRELIEMVGLPESVLDALPGQMSGGQRQRVAIARALSLKPDAIIADEPTSALDVSVRAQILNLLMDLKKELGLSMVFISHDIQTVRYISDRIIVMNAGQAVEQGTAAEVFNHPKDDYTRLLLGAAPSLLHPDLGK